MENSSSSRSGSSLASVMSAASSAVTMVKRTASKKSPWTSDHHQQHHQPSEIASEEGKENSSGAKRDHKSKGHAQARMADTVSTASSAMALAKKSHEREGDKDTSSKVPIEKKRRMLRAIIQADKEGEGIPSMASAVATATAANTLAKKQKTKKVSPERKRRIVKAIIQEGPDKIVRNKEEPSMMEAVSAATAAASLAKKHKAHHVSADKKRKILKEIINADREGTLPLSMSTTVQLATRASELSRKAKSHLDSPGRVDKNDESNNNDNPDMADTVSAVAAAANLARKHRQHHVSADKKRKIVREILSANKEGTLPLSMPTAVHLATKASELSKKAKRNVSPERKRRIVRAIIAADQDSKQSDHSSAGAGKLKSAVQATSAASAFKKSGNKVPVEKKRKIVKAILEQDRQKQNLASVVTTATSATTLAKKRHKVPDEKKRKVLRAIIESNKAGILPSLENDEHENGNKMAKAVIAASAKAGIPKASPERHQNGSPSRPKNNVNERNPSKVSPERKRQLIRAIIEAHKRGELNLDEKKGMASVVAAAQHRRSATQPASSASRFSREGWGSSVKGRTSGVIRAFFNRRQGFGNNNQEKMYQSGTESGAHDHDLDQRSRPTSAAKTAYQQQQQQQQQQGGGGSSKTTSAPTSPLKDKRASFFGKVSSFSQAVSAKVEQAKDAAGSIRVPGINKDKCLTLLVVDTAETDWSKYFRGRRVLNGEYDVRVEQAEFKELTVTASSENGTTAGIVMHKTGSKMVRSFKPDFLLVRQNLRDASEDFRNLLLGFKFSDIPSINSLQAIYNFQDKPWVYAELLKIQKRLGKEAFPLIEQTYYPNQQEMTPISRYPCVAKVAHAHGGTGKIRVENSTQFQDLVSVIALSTNYCTIEPYVDAKYDLHVQKIGDNYKAWMRKSLSGNWKTNIGQSILEEISVESRYKSWIDEVSKIFGGLDICSIEVMVAKDGQEFIIEVNDSATTLMTESQEEDRKHIADLVVARMEACCQAPVSSSGPPAAPTTGSHQPVARTTSRGSINRQSVGSLSGDQAPVGAATAANRPPPPKPPNAAPTTSAPTSNSSSAKTRTSRRARKDSQESESSTVSGASSASSSAKVSEGQNTAKKDEAANKEDTCEVNAHVEGEDTMKNLRKTFAGIFGDLN